MTAVMFSYCIYRKWQQRRRTSRASSGSGGGGGISNGGGVRSNHSSGAIVTTTANMAQVRINQIGEDIVSEHGINHNYNESNDDGDDEDDDHSESDVDSVLVNMDERNNRASSTAAPASLAPVPSTSIAAGAGGAANGVPSLVPSSSSNNNNKNNTMAFPRGGSADGAIAARRVAGGVVDTREPELSSVSHSRSLSISSLFEFPRVDEDPTKDTLHPLTIGNGTVIPMLSFASLQQRAPSPTPTPTPAIATVLSTPVIPTTPARNRYATYGSTGATQPITTDPIPNHTRLAFANKNNHQNSGSLPHIDRRTGATWVGGTFHWPASPLASANATLTIPPATVTATSTPFDRFDTLPHQPQPSSSPVHHPHHNHHNHNQHYQQQSQHEPRTVPVYLQSTSPSVSQRSVLAVEPARRTHATGTITTNGNSSHTFVSHATPSVSSSSSSSTNTSSNNNTNNMDMHAKRAQRTMMVSSADYNRPSQHTNGNHGLDRQLSWPHGRVGDDVPIGSWNTFVDNRFVFVPHQPHHQTQALHDAWATPTASTPPTVPTMTTTMTGITVTSPSSVAESTTTRIPQQHIRRVEIGNRSSLDDNDNDNDNADDDDDSDNNSDDDSDTDSIGHPAQPTPRVVTPPPQQSSGVDPSLTPSSVSSLNVSVVATPAIGNGTTNNAVVIATPTPLGSHSHSHRVTPWG
jgi:hypothetical protein